MKLKVLYWGGSLLIGDGTDEDSFEPLARFDDLEGNPPCLISRRLGKGIAVLSAIHPEVGVAQIAPFLTGEYHSVEFGREIARRLAPFEQSRRAIWDDLMESIVSHHRGRLMGNRPIASNIAQSEAKGMSPALV